MSEFNLDVPIVQALIADSQSCCVAECATAWLTTYHTAQARGAEDASALLEAAAAWDRTAAEWRPHTADGQEASAP